MRWEVLVLMLVVGLINLIARWLSARSERQKQAQIDTQSRPPSAPQAPQPPRRVVRVERPARVVPAPAPLPAPVAARARSASPSTSPAASETNMRRADRPSAVAASVASPASVGPSAPVAPKPFAVPPSRAERRGVRWTASAIRRAFIASEIFAKPVSLRG
jgi:hypothetical protein